MNLSKDQQKEIALFPPALQALITAELAAGNSIDEVGHGFPAPPVGAYVKLAKPVSTRSRATGDGLSFYERNSSSYSGEFTDAKRFYFVLEPPNPPPPEPDMDAIRKTAENKDDALTRLAQRQASGIAEGLKRLRSKLVRSAPVVPPRSNPELALQGATATSAVWLLHFRDARPPQEIQAQLERDLMTLMPPCMESGKLVCRADTKITGAPYSFVLTYEAALLRLNCYSLRVEVSWADAPATHHDYYRKTSSSWFGLWTRDFAPAGVPAAAEGSAARYGERAEAALQSEAHLDSVAALQNAIVAGLKRGATFATAHKEGGTNISWRDGRFVRSDYGESENHKTYSDEAEFLKFLRQFYDWETSRNIHPNKVSDLDAWKLIRRLLRNA